jgi:hypothetical protein
MRLSCLARASARGVRRFARTGEETESGVRRFARTGEETESGVRRFARTGAGARCRGTPTFLSATYLSATIPPLNLFPFITSRYASCRTVVNALIKQVSLLSGVTP